MLTRGEMRCMATAACWVSTTPVLCQWGLSPDRDPAVYFFSRAWRSWLLETWEEILFYGSLQRRGTYWVKLSGRQTVPWGGGTPHGGTPLRGYANPFNSFPRRRLDPENRDVSPPSPPNFHEEVG